MALVLADRVRETTTTTGTGTISLGGPVSGFQGFSTAIGNANTTYYTIVDAATGAWEVGLGTYTSSGSTLARTTILSSSNAGSAVNFAAGTKDVFVTQPAERALYLNGAGTGVDAGAAAFTANGVVYASSTSALATGSALTFDGANLGVGISSPGSGKFQVKQSLGVTSDSAIRITDDATTSMFFNNTASGVSSIWSSGSLAFGVSSGNPFSEAMRLTSSGLEIKQSQLIGYSSYAGIGTNGLAVAGNVGVGTASPGSRLNVVGGSVTLSGTASFNSEIFQEATAKRGLIFGYETASQVGIIASHTNGNPSNLAFWTFSGSAWGERARIDSAGNLGLGVTPGTWSDGKAFEINTAGNSLWGEGNFTVLTQNARYNSGYKYARTGVESSHYDLDNGSHKWYTAPSGTAGNAISFTQAMTLDASGNLGVGETNPAFRLDVKASRATSRLTSSTGTNAVDFQANNTGGQLLLGIDSSTGGSLFGAGGYTAGLFYSGAYPLIFGTNNAEKMRLSSDGTFRVKGAGTAGSTDAFQVAGTAPADAARITIDGNFLVGQTSGGSRVSVTATGTNYAGYFNYSNAGQGVGINSVGVGTTYAMYFFNDSTNVGGILTSSTTTSYITSSDYRLKNITGPITTSGAYIDSLNPVEGTWKADGSTFVGLIAHEVQDASRTNVATGEKDGEQMQGMDYSSAELIANMLAELQSLRARVASLESSTLQ